jgi:hypothetical protein
MFYLFSNSLVLYILVGISIFSCNNIEKTSENSPNLQSKEFPSNSCFNFNKMVFENCNDTTLLRFYKEFSIIEQNKNSFLIHHKIKDFSYKFNYSNTRKLIFNIIDEYSESGDLHYFIIGVNNYFIPHETYFNLHIFKLDEYLNPKELLVFRRGTSGEQFQLSNYLKINHQTGISTNYILFPKNTLQKEPKYFTNYETIDAFYADSIKYMQEYDSIQVFKSQSIKKYWFAYLDHDFTESIIGNFISNEVE